MVILNDLGLSLEIFGFLIFLFIPITETYGVLWKKPKENPITKFLNNHDKTRFFLRGLGVMMIAIGLVFQYSFLNAF